MQVEPIQLIGNGVLCEKFKIFFNYSFLVQKNAKEGSYKYIVLLRFFGID